MGQATARDNSEPRGVVAVGASAGGVEALTDFAAGLSRDLPFAITVVLHMRSRGASALSAIIDRSGPLPAEPARHGEHLRSGRIYVGVPDHHLLVTDGHLVLSEGPTENGHRPAINALFRSVALAYGPRAVGLVLSGVLDDGVLGAAAIRARGGSTIVQEPGDALFSGMPLNAIEAGVVDHRVAAGKAGRLLLELADREIEDKEMEHDAQMELENRIAMGRRFSTSFDTEELGPPSGYVCPDCSGSLQAVSEGNFRCRVGHAWTGEALLAARDEEVEGALWVAVRSLQEKSKLARAMAQNLDSGANSGPLYEKYSGLADEAERAVKILSDRLAQAYTEVGQQDAG